MTYPFFSDRELMCRCGRCGLAADAMDPRFMEKLIGGRYAFGAPLRLTSAVRCETHNHAVGGAPGSAHLRDANGKAHAVDIHISDVQTAFRLMGIFQAVGMKGFGVRMHGPIDQRLLHVDDIEIGPGRPRPALWTYA